MASLPSAAVAPHANFGLLLKKIFLLENNYLIQHTHNI